MAITSIGYDGTIDETNVAQWLGYSTSAAWGVNQPDSFAASTVAGQVLQVRIKGGTQAAPATAWKSGLVDFMVGDATLQLAPVSSGSRWDMIVMRRDYQPPGGVSSLQVIQGGASMTLPPREINDGVIEDQPLWLVKVTAGQSVPTQYVDLRTFARNGGMTANHDLVRSYVGLLGTMIEINGIFWLRRVGANGAAEWVKLIDSNLVEVACPLRVGVTGQLKASFKDGLVVVDGRLDTPVTQPGTVRPLGWLPNGIPNPTGFTRHGVGATIENHPLVARITTDGQIEVINRTSAPQSSASVSFTYRAG